MSLCRSTIACRECSECARTIFSIAEIESNLILRLVIYCHFTVYSPIIFHIQSQVLEFSLILLLLKNILDLKWAPIASLTQFVWS